MIDFLSKESFAVLAILVSIVNYAIYIFSIRFKDGEPHIFSWMIWSILTLIACTAQWSEGGGAGALVTGMISFFCVAIVVLSFSEGEKKITFSDKLSFVAALGAIPLWLMMKDPLLAVLLVTTIHLLGYYPTFRKSYFNPYGEPVFCYCMGGIVWALAVAALGNYSITTFLYPMVLVISNFSMAVFLLGRRRMVQKVTS